MFPIAMKHGINAWVNGCLAHTRVVLNAADPIAFVSNEITGCARQLFFARRSRRDCSAHKMHADRLAAIYFDCNASSSKQDNAAPRANQISYAGGRLPSILLESQREFTVIRWQILP